MIQYKNKQWDCIIEQYDNGNGVHQHIWKNVLPGGRADRSRLDHFDRMEVKFSTHEIKVVALFKVKLKNLHEGARHKVNNKIYEL